MPKLQSFVLLLIIVTTSCLDPINSTIGEYENLLVVDAFISNECNEYVVKITRTVANIDEEPDKISGAKVSVQDDQNQTYNFEEREPGAYYSNKDEFWAEPGYSYQLFIQTPDGNHYESTSCKLMLPGNIDSVYYKPATIFKEDNGENMPGISIYVDGTGNSDSDYSRWTYTEDWKFKIPYPTNMIVNEDNQKIYVAPQNMYCWKSAKQNTIITHTFKNQINTSYSNKKLLNIITEETDKTSIRYSIEVKQHSISKQEYDFWQKLSASNEEVGDLFGKQPFSIQSNIRNVNDPSEPILGYFQVSGVSSQRIYITYQDIYDLKLRQYYNYDCIIDTIMPDGVLYKDVYSIYYYQTIINDRHVAYGVFDAMGISLLGLVYTEDFCADCSLSGNPEAPSYWIE